MHLDVLVGSRGGALERDAALGPHIGDGGQCRVGFAVHPLDDELPLVGKPPQASRRHRPVREGKPRRHVKPQGLVVPDVHRVDTIGHRSRSLAASAS